jgi:hypothetical protein
MCCRGMEHCYINGFEARILHKNWRHVIKPCRLVAGIPMCVCLYCWLAWAFLLSCDSLGTFISLRVICHTGVMLFAS